MKHVLINPPPKYMSTNFRRELHSRLISNTILNFWQPKLWNSGTEKKMTKDTKLWEYDQLETTKVILVIAILPITFQHWWKLCSPGERRQNKFN